MTEEELEELKKLQRDLEGLLEANRLDWYDLATKFHSGEERIAIRKAIAAKTIDIGEMLSRKWTLEAKLKMK
jgi:hypothetical protein